MKRFLAVVIILTGVGMAGEVLAKGDPKGTLRVQGGTNIEKFGFAIDGSYDPRLDELIPGYRVVNVAIVNNSLNIILLDPEKDRWFVRVGSKKKYPAIIDLRRADPDAWMSIPLRARGLLVYPLAIPIGARLVVDLFVSEDVRVDRLTEINVSIASLGTTFSVLVQE